MFRYPKVIPRKTLSILHWKPSALTTRKTSNVYTTTSITFSGLKNFFAPTHPMRWRHSRDGRARRVKLKIHIICGLERALNEYVHVLLFSNVQICGYTWVRLRVSGPQTQTIFGYYIFECVLDPMGLSSQAKTQKKYQNLTCVACWDELCRTWVAQRKLTRHVRISGCEWYRWSDVFWSGNVLEFDQFCNTLLRYDVNGYWC